MKIEDFDAYKDMLNILRDAYMYDDKPHRLYYTIIKCAEKYIKDPNTLAEIQRLMKKEAARARF